MAIVLVTIIATAAVAAIPVIYFSVNYSCSDVNCDSTVYSGDTVIVADDLSPKCHNMATIVQTGHPDNIIYLYATDCGKVNVYTELPQNTTPVTLSNVSTGINVLFDSNYLVQGSIINISLHVESLGNQEVYMCIFSSNSDFEQFRYSQSSADFKIALKAAAKCILEIAPIALTTVTLPINKTGYYYVGIRSLPEIALVEYSLALTRKYYNQSDFLRDRIGFHQFNVTYTKTCVMAYAVQGEVAQFSSISVKADGISFTQTSNINWAYLLLSAVPIIPVCCIFVYALVYCRKKSYRQLDNN